MNAALTRIAAWITDRQFTHDLKRMEETTPMTYKLMKRIIETGLKKFGAMLGDGVEVGCNTVMNPGTVVGAHSNVYPLSRVRGFVPALRIFKDPDNIVEKW